MKNKLLFLLIILMAFLLISCNESDSGSNEELDVGSNIEETEETQEAEEEEKKEKDIIDEEEELISEEEIEYEKLSEEEYANYNVNELGQIMVLMYHNIGEEESEWVRTPDNFRKDLQYLYDNGYRPISLEDYVNGNINIEAGYTPFVLTVDDGRQNNFNIIGEENGEKIIDPDSFMGILLDFNEKNPDFELRATFFINGGIPFGQEEYVDYKLNFIVDNGMDIGNHTYNHPNLNDLSKEEINYQIGRLNELVYEYVDDYEVNTLALPFGSRPKDSELNKYLNKGEYNGEKYENIAILEVGWDPYRSPFHKDFDPLRIRRVRASKTNVDGVGMYDWLDRFESGQRIRYISDGSPNTIVIPDSYSEILKESLMEDYDIIKY